MVLDVLNVAKNSSVSRLHHANVNLATKWSKEEGVWSVKSLFQTVTTSATRENILFVEVENTFVSKLKYAVSVSSEL